MPKIDKLEIDLFRLPLPEAMEASAAGVMTAFDMVAARITDSATAPPGVGYTVLHAGAGRLGRGGDATAPFRPEHPGGPPIRTGSRRLWRQTCGSATHYAGRGGPTVTFALAAVDTALWDLKGRQAGRSRSGGCWAGHDPKVRAYAGNIDLNFPVAKLVEGGHRERSRRASTRSRCGSAARRWAEDIGPGRGDARPRCPTRSR